MKRENEAVANQINRTGVLLAPELAQEMVDGVNQFSPEAVLDGESAESMRAEYVQEAPPIGSLPDSADGPLSMLLDKLGARLAFERSGVRLYEALIRKREAVESDLEEPTVGQLQEMRDEELDHMHMLEECIVEFGGDPTVLTPAADISGTMNSGVLKVVADPRTTIPQCLEAILTAELVDNDCWGVLIPLMEVQGMDEDLEDFKEALAEEQEHLTKVRQWILNAATTEKT
jgi:hypothetical protein